MKKHTAKLSAIIFFILLSTSIFANKTPNYPKGFSPKTNSAISFTENKGQIHDQNYKSRPDVLFGGSDGNLVFHLKNNGISYQLNRVDTWKKESDLIKNHADTKIQKDEKKLVADQTTIYRLDINWLNANTNAELTKQNPLDGFNNYYLENCPNGALNVKSYQQITYQNIYDGIDLKWYEKNGHLEYDYLVSAGADYKQIQLEIKGADKITVNNKGELTFKTPLGDITQQAPLVIQNGKTLKSKWIIKNNVLSFEIENIKKSEAFIIDPVVRSWGTYYGQQGSSTYPFSCTIDANANVYMSGIAGGAGFGIATLGSHQVNFAGGFDAFLVKFNSAGIRQWGTYYGGSGLDYGYSSATDATSNIFMVGSTTSSSSIATMGSHQPSYGGGALAYGDAFLVKFNSAGIRQWGTYYGGIGDENGYSCAVDLIGNVYMAGQTNMAGNALAISSGTTIATIGSHQTIFANQSLNYFGDAFLVKFNSAGVRQWGTYYGGNYGDYASGCVTDANGNIYMTGLTSMSTGTIIATLGSHQANIGGAFDAFLVKFNSAGVRQWGTYYGGIGNESSSADFGADCAIDANSNIYMTGVTSMSSGTTIATLGSHQATIGGGVDAFLVKFNSAGIRQWGTYYGGVGIDEGFSCATDATSNVYMVGSTTSSSSIAPMGSHQLNSGGSSDAFLVKFNSAGIRQWGTYYGGIGDEEGYSCATDATSNVYMVGSTTSSTSIATMSSHQSTISNIGGGYDSFLVKFNECLSPTITVNSGVICAGQSFTINPTGAYTYSIQGGNAVVSPSINTNYTVIGTSVAGCTNTTVSAVTVNPNPIITVNSGTICVGQNFTINPNGANTYTIQGGNAVVSPPSSTSFTVIGTNSVTGCGSQAFATSSLIVNQNPIITVNSGAICAGQNFTINPNGANTYTIQGGNAIVSPLSNTNYTVIGTNTLTGCRSQSFATSNLIVNANPTITLNSGSICAGQNFTINPNGANTYTIQGGNAVVSPTSNASYTVAGTSTSGCKSLGFATSNLTVNPNPTITVNSGAICAGQSFTINPNGANTYTIQGGNAVVNPTSNASYTVAGTSASGCKSLGFATSNLIVNPNPTITVNSGAICAGQSFTINPNGANTYTIQGGNPVVSPNSNSSYTVAGTSTSGCKSQGFVTSNLTVNPNPTITVNSGFICAGENFTIYPNGANTYSIQGGSTVVSPTINITYTVAGTNTAGCVSQAFATSSLTVNQCVGISNQNIGIGGVSIYPNPNNGEFTIELVSVNNAYITITNVLGQIIKTQKAELINQINLNLFEKGVYFINVMDNNQSVYKGSIIKE